MPNKKNTTSNEIKEFIINIPKDEQDNVEEFLDKVKIKQSHIQTGSRLLISERSLHERPALTLFIGTIKFGFVLFSLVTFMLSGPLLAMDYGDTLSLSTSEKWLVSSATPTISAILICLYFYCAVIRPFSADDSYKKLLTEDNLLTNNYGSINGGTSDSDEEKEKEKEDTSDNDLTP